MCRLLHIHKTRTTPYHPKSDGMVERFDKTLDTMLSAYVQDNHKDWDVHLPYAMMAYRSAEHETTGLTPNVLMLGREVSTPVDLMYGMSSSVKGIPSNKWALELKERLEEAHKLVRKNTDCSMKRQKKYDVKNSWEQFDVGQLVYVFLPVKKVGISGKFTSYWKGPLQVVGKMSDVLYSIDCGGNGSHQVIHCDRIRRCPEQVMKG